MLTKLKEFLWFVVILLSPKIHSKVNKDQGYMLSQADTKLFTYSSLWPFMSFIRSLRLKTKINKHSPTKDLTNNFTFLKDRATKWLLCCQILSAQPMANFPLMFDLPVVSTDKCCYVVCVHVLLHLLNKPIYQLHVGLSSVLPTMKQYDSCWACFCITNLKTSNETLKLCFHLPFQNDATWGSLQFLLWILSYQVVVF